jgi:hypothetical protein
MKDTSCHRYESPLSRRDFLFRSGVGLGAIALQSLLTQNAVSAAGAKSTGPLAAKPPQLKARAKNIIFLFMEGGPSHIDLFDPKPLLNELAGKPLPASFGEIITAMGEAKAPLLGSKRTWKQHGQSGIWVSDWLPETAKMVDDIAVIRSCWADGINHSAGVCQMNTGSILGGRPSLGSWVSYGLGTENTDLPAFVVMQDTQTSVVNGPRNWSAGFMPAVYQGIRIQGGNEPIPHLNTPDALTPEQQRSKLEFACRPKRHRRLIFQAKAKRRRNFTASTTKKPRRWAACVCYRAAWWSAACASCRFIMARAANGIHTRPSKKTTRSFAKAWICPSLACCVI